MTSICLPDETARQHVQPLPDGIEVVVWDGNCSPMPAVDGVDMLVPSYGTAAPGAAVVARYSNLRVIQLLTAGVEPWLDLVPPGVVLCDGRGVHGASTAELAVAGVLSLMRELPRFRDAQLVHRWDHADADGIDGKRVLVVGAGDIGTRVAAALEALGAEVTFVARGARDGVRAVGELPQLLPLHEVVVLALPHTPDTHHLVDAAFLASMPDGAIVANVARGAIVDTEALLAELQSRRLRAFLDVVDPEPLPAEHPLWTAPNLLITPHVGGGTRGWEQRAYQLVRDQVIRLHNGEPLRNVVTDGY